MRDIPLPAIWKGYKAIRSSLNQSLPDPDPATGPSRGDAIFRRPHFVKYLRYFVYGPDLPKPVIEAFQQKVIDCGTPFTSGDSITLRDFARHLTRSHGLAAGDAAEEFYKLALDCGLDAGDARSVRDVVKKLR